MKRISVVKDLENVEHNNAFCVLQNHDDVKSVYSCHGLEVDGPCQFKYGIDERFATFNIVWAETDSDITPYRGNFLRKLPPMKHYIHIDRDAIMHNIKSTDKKPVCNIDGKIYCMELNILGPSRMIYSPDNPHNTGAKLWIETDDEIEAIGEQ
jgi:hypothetical protein